MCSSSGRPFVHAVLYGVLFIEQFSTVAYPGILFRGRSTNSGEDRGQRERESGGGSLPVRGSEGSCNLVQDFSIYIVKSS